MKKLSKSTSLVSANSLSLDKGLSSYVAQIKKFPVLSAADEYMLAKRYQLHADKEAAHRLVTSHLRLVVKIAHGYRGYGLPVPELIAEGNIGLMQAVKKFDPDKGFRLSTYAMWWIKAAMQEYILRSWSLVKIGTTAAQKKLFFNLRKLKNKILGGKDENLSDANYREIASELEVTADEVKEMDGRMSGADQSLNATYGEEDNAEWIDVLADDRASQEAVLAETEEYDARKTKFLAAFNTLNEREQEIIKARQLSEAAATLEDLSQKYGVSRERIRQIEERALEKLQAKVKENN
jgi:RNA polymerase sigma-32 factor